MSLLTGFAPLVAPDARLLVLGSMPSARSLADHAYYAHPQNGFWRIWEGLIGLDAQAPYPVRVAALTAAGVCVWDVLQHCERPSSLDADIVRGTEVPNDIVSLLATHTAITRVLCNGGAARRMFDRYVARDLARLGREVTVVTVPSTSPAHASVRLPDKIRAWRDAIGDETLGLPEQ